MEKIQTEFSRRYYFEGTQKEYHTQNAAQRMAEWKAREMKKGWGDRYVSSRIITKGGYCQVEMKYRVE